MEPLRPLEALYDPAGLLVPEVAFAGVAVNEVSVFSKRRPFWSHIIVCPVFDRSLLARVYSDGFRLCPCTFYRLGLSGWQILQAICNLSLRQHSPELFDTTDLSAETPVSEVSKLRVLEHLIARFESVSSQLASDCMADTDTIISQIKADSLDLLNYVDPELQPKLDDLQTELARRGLLEGQRLD